MSVAGATILVEDNEDHALIARCTLARGKEGREIVWLRDGEEALRYLVGRSAVPDGNYRPPDLILLDVDLPKVNGKEVLRRIRECAGLRATPVVMLTTSDNRSDVAECYALGANSYVVKPVRFEDLSLKLRAIGAYWYHTNVPDSRFANAGEQA